jgi:RHS repeat-associated protein
MDNLSYKYTRTAERRLSIDNKLNQVTDVVADAYASNDIDNQDLGNYTYDKVGNLTADIKNGISLIQWTPNGKVASVTKTDGAVLSFVYDGMGNRVRKVNTVAGTIQSETTYLRYATGNVLATYNTSNTQSQTLVEQTLYGMQRIGLRSFSLANGTAGNATVPTAVCHYQPSQKVYELSNHLGNVHVVLYNYKKGIDTNGDNLADFYKTTVASLSDYYSFGMSIDSRSYTDTYRYGFNGKERETGFTGDNYDFGARIYDARTGRWLSVDNYFALQPGWTPYRGFFNSPINWIDEDGNIEAPLKGTHVWYSHNSEKISYNHFVKANGMTTKVGRNYNYAFKRTGTNTIYSPKQIAAGKKGMLIVVNSEFFAIRNIGTRPHVGVDFRARTPQPFYSLGDGKIVGKESTDGTGNYLVVEYSNGDKVRFMHLSEYEEGMDKGANVFEGQILGKTGNTGRYKVNGKWKSYDPHLHVDAVTKDGEAVDPLQRQYGTVTNEQFFNEFGGDYEKLKAHKSGQSQDAGNQQRKIAPDNTRVGQGYGF